MVQRRLGGRDGFVVLCDLNVWACIGPAMALHCVSAPHLPMVNAFHLHTGSICICYAIGSLCVYAVRFKEWSCSFPALNEHLVFAPPANPCFTSAAGTYLGRVVGQGHLAPVQPKVSATQNNKNYSTAAFSFDFAKVGKVRIFPG